MTGSVERQGEALERAGRVRERLLSGLTRSFARSEPVRYQRAAAACDVLDALITEVKQLEAQLAQVQRERDEAQAEAARILGLALGKGITFRDLSVADQGASDE